MKRDELRELHFISPVANVSSILKRGILSKNGVQKVDHVSVALGEVQEKRSLLRIPGGRGLHEYANLYFNARNPMLYLRKGQHRELCILRVSPAVLDLPDVVIADGNAASDYTRFAAAPDGVEIVERDLTFAESWTSDDQHDYWERKRRKCAEVLVPGKVPPEFIQGAFVSSTESETAVRSVAPGLSIIVDRHLFFLESTR